MRRSDLKNVVYGSVFALALAGGVTFLATDRQPEEVAFVAERGLSVSTIRFINTSVNNAARPAPECFTGGLACSSDFEPRLSGKVDCKNIAAFKLQELILAGGKPEDFSWWIVSVPDLGGAFHSVLVHNPTGYVLDNLEPRMRTRAQYGKAYNWLARCTDKCLPPAIRAAEAIRPGSADAWLAALTQDQG